MRVLSHDLINRHQLNKLDTNTYIHELFGLRNILNINS
jgi:hypothetical protein